MSKKEKPKSWAEIFNSNRRIWRINPRTRVIPDKKKYSRKEKHKGREQERL